MMTYTELLIELVSCNYLSHLFETFGTPLVLLLGSRCCFIYS